MSPLNVVCSTCGAEVGHRCRTRRTGRTTDTHAARWHAVTGYPS